MNIPARSIVSNSDMMKKYKACRKLADDLNKIFILRNNQPDAVLLSITEYERISPFIEYLDGLSEQEIAEAAASLPEADK